jgi:hypothetical protein
VSLLESFFFILLCHILGSLTSVINSKSNRSELIVSCGYRNFWYWALQNVQAHCWTVLYTVPAGIMQLFYIYVNRTSIKFPFSYITRRWTLYEHNELMAKIHTVSLYETLNTTCHL